MATAKVYTFTFQELATLMVKAVGVREGHWGIQARFGLKATNLKDSGGQLLPGAMVPLMEVGLQRFDEPNNMTVDAAQVNPPEAIKGSKPKRPRS